MSSDSSLPIPRRTWLLAGAATTWAGLRSSRGDEPGSNSRRPGSRDELRTWLENMVWYHRFTMEEISSATGLSTPEIEAALAEFEILPGEAPRRPAEAPLLVLPYPGGRHPRIGFLEGAIDPQRETKISVFTPWDPTSYVVADIPEAIWSNLGLTYLAHTHVPTIWSREGIELPRQEWRRTADGSLELERRLPNGIVFRTRVVAERDGVGMAMQLKNGTDQRLTDLRVQNCVMLKGAPEFADQTNDNKLFRPPFAAAKSQQGDKWVISAWEPCHRPWGNAPCPCLHSDPKFPDCEPGETQILRGWLSFHEGEDVEPGLELATRRLRAAGG